MRRPSKRHLVLLILLLLLIGLVAGIFIFRSLQSKPKHYPGFNLAIPNGYHFIGIDVSRHQNRIFWEEVAKMMDQGAHVSFTFIKSTEGINIQDRYFDSNWKGAGKVGLTRGAYHFFHPSQSAMEQAANFLNHTKLQSGDFRPVLDVEVDELVTSKSLQDSVCKWLTIVGEYYNTAPVIYTSAAFYNKYLKGYFDDYPLWIAHYHAAKPSIKIDFQIWQFNDRGRVNGIDGEVDFNVFNGDSLAVRSMLLR